MGFLQNLFGGDKSPPQRNLQRHPPPLPLNARSGKRDDLLRSGDVINGKYQIQKKLGEGGFGVVYLAFNFESRSSCALKTFRQALLTDTKSRGAFRKEALLWVGLGMHLHIVGARWVEEDAGRLFVEMELILPDEHGRVSLFDHILSTNPPSISQTTEWGIQFCLGMEHAANYAVKCHRDIKPGNILIAPKRTLKISDFGLAVAAETAGSKSATQSRGSQNQNQQHGAAFSIVSLAGREVCGTPGYMAPEVIEQGVADIRSDIYSFGVVLWQMTMGSPAPPFQAAFRGDMTAYLREIYAQQLHTKVTVKEVTLQQIIERCLRVDPAGRYSDFTELRTELVAAHLKHTGKAFVGAVAGDMDGKAWNARGASLSALGRPAEAIECFRKALELMRVQNVASDAPWNNMAVAYTALERYADAVECCEQAVRIEPRSASAWHNKAKALLELGRSEDALACFNEALALDPRYPGAWSSKGVVLHTMGRNTEAIQCFAKALEINRKQLNAWIGKAWALSDMGMADEALKCYDDALNLDPLDADAWDGKARLLAEIGSLDQALVCFEKVVELDPSREDMWTNMGVVLKGLGRIPEAIRCCDRALVLNPNLATPWANKGVYLAALSRHEEAHTCLRKATQLSPGDAGLWNSLAGVLRNLGRLPDALDCCNRFIEIEGGSVLSWRNKGVVLRDMGRRNEEVACYEHALRFDPGSARVWYLKGVAEQALGHNPRARSSLLKFLEIARNDPAEASNMIDARQRLRSSGM